MIEERPKQRIKAEAPQYLAQPSHPVSGMEPLMEYLGDQQSEYISPWAYLRMMALIAWHSFRHPFSTTRIDMLTGECVHE